MTDRTSKRRGRPPLAPEMRKDVNLTFRTRGDLRERLSKEARKNGRTISEEVEIRLERSLEGIIRPEDEPGLYLASVRDMLGSQRDFSEAVELGMLWNRMKTVYSIENEPDGQWYVTESNIDVVSTFFIDRIKRMITVFAARRRQAKEIASP